MELASAVRTRWAATTYTSTDTARFDEYPLEVEGVQLQRERLGTAGEGLRVTCPHHAMHECVRAFRSCRIDTDMFGRNAPVFSWAAGFVKALTCQQRSTRCGDLLVLKSGHFQRHLLLALDVVQLLASLAQGLCSLLFRIFRERSL